MFYDFIFLNKCSHDITRIQFKCVIWNLRGRVFPLTENLRKQIKINDDIKLDRKQRNYHPFTNVPRMRFLSRGAFPKISEIYRVLSKTLAASSVLIPMLPIFRNQGCLRQLKLICYDFYHVRGYFNPIWQCDINNALFWMR